ncbi:MAG TPA: type I methionyl aminopeptidase [Deltaproteobacteria bacterium]|nr:type I methionyl aminopeptidase [Deltaproteobacteria bacterium]
MGEGVGFGERIAIKSRREIERMREVGHATAEILLELRERARPGVTTGELDEIAARALEKRGLNSPFLGYAPGGVAPYPAVLCASVNDEIVHGIPGSRVLREGDILSLDFGVEAGGWHGDSAVTIAIGEIDADAKRLIETTRDALEKGIERMVPGDRLSDIGHAVESRAGKEGYGVVRQFVGHGIGRAMHEPPQVPNYGRPGRGPRLRPGMVFAIEPMVNIGSEKVRVLKDEWTAVTADGSLSAHFEHTVLITDNGPEVLTRIEGSH